MVVFSLADFDQTVFDNLTDGIKNIVMKSPEYQFESSIKGKEPAGLETKPMTPDEFFNDLPDF